MTAIALSAAPGTVDRRFTTGLADALGLQLVDLRAMEIEIARRCDARTGPVQRRVWTHSITKANHSNRELTRRLQREIHEIAGRGNTLIVSWSASFVLLDTSVRVAITGHRALRERNASASLHFADVQTASFEVESEDALITRFIWQTFGVDWRNGSLYDLVIDAGGRAKEHAAESLRQLLTAPLSRPSEAITMLPRPRPTDPSQEMTSEAGEFNCNGRVVIDNDIVSLSGVGSHEDAVAKVEKHMHGCSHKQNRIDPFLTGK